jgi:hypothetical protein
MSLGILRGLTDFNVKKETFRNPDLENRVSLSGGRGRTMNSRGGSGPKLNYLRFLNKWIQRECDLARANRKRVAWLARLRLRRSFLLAKNKKF